MKIIIDGHGGHCCEAYLDGTGIWEIGYTIEDAVCRLLRHPECGVEIEILPCSTTAYERSGQYDTTTNNWY